MLLRQQVAHLLRRQTPGGRLPAVLIQGETGTGKGLLARAMHAASVRAAQPFVDVDCAAIPETLLEAELFGFERGAFTDARQTKLGLFQTASGGTIFLDEIGLLPKSLQVKLLKVVEERGVRRLGSTRVDVVDLWVIAATNMDLAPATREGRFREDLYHRLAAVTLVVPPLRERAADIVRLAEHFLARACAEYRVPPKRLAPDAEAALQAYSWPGNVRELANTLERVVLLSGDSTGLSAEVLALPSGSGSPAVRLGGESRERSPLKASVEGFERDHLRSALGEAGWNISLAAARLGVPRNTLRYRIAKLGLRPDAPAVPEDPRRPPAKVAARGAATEIEPWRPRIVTFLRAVVSGAPEPGQVGRVLEVIADKVRSFGGQVEAIEDAGLLAAFGIDPAEDAAGRAAHAALAVLKVRERVHAADREGPSVRMAIHECPARVRRRDGSAELDEEGRRRAAGALESLLAEAPPDSAVVSTQLAGALQTRFELSSSSASELAAGAAYRVVGRLQKAGEPRENLLIPLFVGRQDELAILEAMLDQAAAGRGQVVGITGEPGIGKSRLLQEFHRRLERRRIAYRQGNCVSYWRAMPYAPLLDVFREAYGITGGDAGPEISQKVRRGLEQAGMDPDEWAPYLLVLWGLPEETERLAGLSPEGLRSRVFETLRRVAVERSWKQPLVLAIEDLHWLGKTA
ncbi:MAG TPA: sigma 54-interacting transcriptional regulator, partial [Methylomirabilota bacterium]|nr:sigma 54-interacting transcriptional regulator [Methylomirabilota bacterium]